MLISKFSNEKVEFEIRVFEEKFQFEFPLQYKRFLLKYNGGQTPKTKFTINKKSSDLRGFFGFGNADENYNFTNYFRDDDEIWNFINNMVCPIGKNNYGDYILIGVGKENNGVIYFMYHDRPQKNIELCLDFALFIKKCKSETIGHIETIEERKEYMIANGNGDLVDDGLIEIWQAEIDRYANINQEELILE